MSSERALIPSIIARDFNEVREKIALVRGFAPWAQLDIADGNFASPETWNNPLELVELGCPPKYEAHLMLREPETVIGEWIDAVQRVYVHIEATQEMEKIILFAHTSRVELGVALTLDTPIAKLMPYMNRICSVQLMSVASLGSYGAPFDERVYERIKILRAQCPFVTISVDGGVSNQNAERLIDAGATRLVAGSAIFSAEDPRAAFEELYAIVTH